MAVSQIFDIKPDLYMVFFSRGVFYVLLIGLSRISDGEHVFNVHWAAIFALIWDDKNKAVYSFINQAAVGDDIPSVQPASGFFRMLFMKL